MLNLQAKQKLNGDAKDGDSTIRKTSVKKGTVQPWIALAQKASMVENKRKAVS